MGMAATVGFIPSAVGGKRVELSATGKVFEPTPANVRELLPGPLGMYATLLGILATPAALGALAWWLHQPPAPPRPPAILAPRRHRALPSAAHSGLPMLSPPEPDWEAS